MNDLKLKRGNALKVEIDKINCNLYNLQKLKELCNNGDSKLYLTFTKYSTIGVDNKLTKIIIETTINHFEQILDTLKKEYEEL